MFFEDKLNYKMFKINLIMIKYFFIIIVLFFSCKKDNMIDKIEACCKHSMPCTISMNDIVTTDWDKMYYFPVGTSSDFIAKKTKLKTFPIIDIGSSLLFVKKDTLVFGEYLYYSPERPNNKDWAIALPDTVNYAAFDRTNSKFIVHKIKIDENVFIYEFNHIN